MHLLEFLHNQSKYIKLLVVGAIESQLNFNKSRKMSSNIDQFEKQTVNILKMDTLFTANYSFTVAHSWVSCCNIGIPFVIHHFIHSNVVHAKKPHTKSLFTSHVLTTYTLVSYTNIMTDHVAIRVVMGKLNFIGLFVNVYLFD